MENPLLKYLLKNEPEKTISKMGIKVRRLIFPLVGFVGSKLYNLKIEKVEINEIPKDRPVVFACTHGFKEDFLASLVTVDEDFYVLFGNRQQALGCIDGFCAWVTGMILVDRFDKESRKASKAKMVYALKLGAKVAIFPEGTWNNSPNKIILDLFPGIWDVARDANAYIVPIATLKGNDRVYSSIGKAIDPNALNKTEGMVHLRDTMASLKYELMIKEKENDDYVVPHGDEGLNYWKNIVDKEINSVKFYDRNAELQAVYRR